ncbi:hypothetical protein ACIBL6_17925 [Streptomyces sp. NPDC050400]|uniref:hypothetical protein n=1 Tax=Streptomyces sp. NPDC050400 TaxID=3365610 RepID=UPI0037B54172
MLVVVRRVGDQPEVSAPGVTWGWGMGWVEHPVFDAVESEEDEGECGQEQHGHGYHGEGPPGQLCWSGALARL